LEIRTELIGATITGLTAIIATFTVIKNNTNGNAYFASLASLSLIYALGITGLLNLCTRTFNQLESSMRSCRRLLHYTQNIPQEAPFTSNELEKHYSNPKNNAGGSPFNETVPSTYALSQAGGKAATKSFDWPENGAITLQNLKMRYMADSPLVLKGITLSIRGGERVSIIDGEGNEKYSPLFLCLLRLVEPDIAGMIQREEGQSSSRIEDKTPTSYIAPISIDGVDILRIGLTELRRKVTIISGKATLFGRTIRSNLDPFDEYSKHEIWTSITTCHMKDLVEAMPGLLEAKVTDYGENLCLKTRQLMILCRAHLRQCKILMLDEAKLSIDFEIIRKLFSGCTILTIAYSINTMLDSDRLLVLKDGEVAEFAPWRELIADDEGAFSSIIREIDAEEKDIQSLRKSFDH